MLHQVYWDTLEQRNTSLEDVSASSFFPSSVLFSPREKAMFGCLDMIIGMPLPLSYVEREEVRRFSVHEDQFSRTLVREVIFKLTEEVEKKIKLDMRDTKGAVMHDGWNSIGRKYLGVIALYLKSFRVIENGEVVGKKKLKFSEFGLLQSTY